MSSLSYYQIHADANASEFQQRVDVAIIEWFLTNAALGDPTKASNWLAVFPQYVLAHMCEMGPMICTALVIRGITQNSSDADILLGIGDFMNFFVTHQILPK